VTTIGYLEIPYRWLAWPHALALPMPLLQRGLRGRCLSPILIPETGEAYGRRDDQPEDQRACARGARAFRAAIARHRERCRSRAASATAGRAGSVLGSAPAATGPAGIRAGTRWSARSRREDPRGLHGLAGG